MNRRLLIASTLATLLLAIAVWAWQQPHRQPTPASTQAPSAAPSSPTNSAPAAPAIAATTSPGNSDRSDGTQLAREPAPSTAMTSHPQGLRGLVVDVAQQPLAGLAVHLAESASNEPFSPDLLQQQRHVFAPLASTTTALDGTFAIGLPIAQDKVYEVYVVSPAHAAARIGGLRLVTMQWHDLGAITMVPGATLRGRVTVAGRSDIPVPQALVTVEIGSAFADAALRGLPGSTPGLMTTTAADGSYELQHVPSRGVVQVAAVAPGFARVLRSDIQLQRDEPTVVDFGLPPGLTLGGSVTDSSGAPVRDARIEAWPQKAAGHALIGRSDARGNFVVAGLVDGPYRVRVQASGFETWQQLDVPAGRTDLLCALTARSRASVRVTTPAGVVVRDYHLTVRRYFPEHGGKIGALADVPDQQIRLDGFTDRAEVRDLPPGNLVCEVEANGFAKTLSPPIDNNGKAGAPLPREHVVEIVLTVGGTLHGVVVDEAGQPLAGASITTMTDGALPDSPLQQMLAGTMPERITSVRTATRADGSFTLRALALADYQLLAEHPEGCRTIVRAIRIPTATEQQLPPIRLPRGAQVQGRITRGGAAIVGQAKVVLSTATADSSRDALRIEATTGPDGSYSLPRRVPPGNYELRAAVLGTTEPEAQIFQQLLQLQRSSTTVSIAPGQTLVQRDLDLPTER